MGGILFVAAVLMQSTSLTLLRRLRRADEPEAWDRFTRLYSTGIYTWVRRMGFRHEDAADIVQDVFLTLVQKLPEFERQDGRTFRGWLWAVTRNKCREWARRRKLVLVSADSLDKCADRTEEPFWEAEFRRHLIRQVAAVIEADYPPVVWRAFWEHAAEGKAASRVASELGINLWAVYAAKTRVVARIHEEFADLVAE